MLGGMMVVVPFLHPPRISLVHKPLMSTNVYKSLLFYSALKAIEWLPSLIMIPSCGLLSSDISLSFLWTVHYACKLDLGWKFWQKMIQGLAKQWWLNHLTQELSIIYLECSSLNSYFMKIFFTSVFYFIATWFLQFNRFYVLFLSPCWPDDEITPVLMIGSAFNVVWCIWPRSLIMIIFDGFLATDDLILYVYFPFPIRNQPLCSSSGFCSVGNQIRACAG